MKALLDTNILVAESFSHEGFQVAVSSLSWAELHFGLTAPRDPLEKARRRTRLARLKTVLGPGVPFDDKAAEAFETVCELAVANGRSVRGRSTDLMIAATAVAHGAAVITRNPDDFAGMDGLLEVIEG